MAFVIQSERKPTHIQQPCTNQEIGPGTYLGLEELQVNGNFVAFNSNEPRGQDFVNKSSAIVPGPGQYNVQQNYFNEKVVVASANEDIKIVEVPNPQSVFKSNTRRFQQQKVQNPGPGEYNVQEAISSIQKHWPESKQKNDVLSQLMTMNKYEKIPSIPGKQQIFGYTENENNGLELNRLPQNLHTGIKDDRIGPGHYQNKDQFEVNQQKGTTRWAKDQDQRFKHKQSKSVGPGQYDVQTQFMPLYKLKQNVGFASKTMRTSEQRKGQIANQFLKQRSIQSSETSMRTRGGTDFEDSDSEYEYIDDCTPGPGHYNNESIISAIKPQTKQEKFQFFGSGQVRFKAENKVSHTGPGDYKGAELSCFKNKQGLTRNRKPPFQSSNTRFEMKSIKDKKPGPSSYNPKISLKDTLIGKIQKGYRGNFGTTDSRFKPSGMEELPGPGAYLDPIQENEEDIAVPTATFKSGVKRGVFAATKEQLKKPPVGSYSLNYYNIEKQVNKKKDEDDDDDLSIPYPAFGSSLEHRFGKPQIKQNIDEDDEDEFDTYTKDKTASLYPKPRQNARFGSKAERFNYKQIGAQIPGPGRYYDNNLNAWNKRTYNVRFAEI